MSRMDNITEVDRTDGWQCAQRILAELAVCEDLETGRALWFALRRYVDKARAERAGERTDLLCSRRHAPLLGFGEDAGRVIGEG